MDPTGRKDRMAGHLGAGTLFDDKYRIIGPLGSGAFATVVHARHEAMERDVAIKFLRPEVVEADPAVSERFIKEVRIVSRLTSPHTVMVYDFGQTADRVHYMVLEYVDGESLEAILERHGPIKPRQAVRLCMQLLESLEEAHRQGVIHRDLKPANLMLGHSQGKKNQLKVLDFGVAKLLESAQQAARNGAKTGEGHGRSSTQFVGTPTYMSPEQILGQPVGPPSDIYSVGLIFYELLTARPAIEETNVTAVARIHLDERPIPMVELPRLPAPLVAIIRKATARKPEQRYESADAMHRALKAVMTGAKGEASATGPGRERAATDPTSRKMAEADASDVFLGRSYIASPETPAGGVRRPSPAPSPRVELPKPARNQSGPRPSASLEIDESATIRARRRRSSGAGSSSPPAKEVTVDDLRRRSENKEARSQLGLGIILSIGLLLATYLAFIVASAPLVGQPTPFRIFVGLLPLGAATLWSSFDNVPAHHAGWVRRRLVPVTRHTTEILLVLLFVYAFVAHSMATRVFADESAWIYAHLPEHIVFDVFERATRRMGEVLSGLYAVIGRTLPW